MKDKLQWIRENLRFFVKTKLKMKGRSIFFERGIFFPRIASVSIINRFFTVENLIRDQGIQRLFKGSLFVAFFVVVMGGGYGCLATWLIPYYQSTQMLNQQILSENELKRLSVQNPIQWEQFNKANSAFYLTNIKMKAVFHTLCRLYQVHLKAGEIHEVVTEKNLSFKPISITVTATTDGQIFGLLQHLASKLSGVLIIKVVKLHRNRDFNEKLLAEIKSGQEKGDLVEALIEFEWLVLKS